jgi:hypothetical protein
MSNEYKDRLQDTRELAIKQVTAVIDSGLDIELKIRTRIHIREDQYITAGSLSKPPLGIPVDSVTTSYHDGIVADAQQAIANWKTQNGKLQKELDKVKRMRATSTDINNGLHEELDGLRGVINRLHTEGKKLGDVHREALKENKQLWADLREKTAPEEKTTEITAGSDHRHESTEPVEIRPIRQNAMVKGLVKTKEELAADKENDPFDNVRKKVFYTDKVPAEPKNFPKFKGNSLLKGGWIYLKQRPINQLAKDEDPRLNLRSKRPRHGSLNTNEVWQLRRYFKSGRKNAWIQERMGLSSAAVSQFKTGKTYKKVPPEPKMVKEAVKPTTVHAGEGVIVQKKGSKS